MSMKTLLELALSNKSPTLTPKQRAALDKDLAQWDHECEKRERDRKLSKEQLDKLIDYGVRNP